MAIQKINLGTEPLGEGGDTYRSANTKINENFSNTEHAASRLVGTGNGQVATWKSGSIEGTGIGGTATVKPKDREIGAMGGGLIMGADRVEGELPVQTAGFNTYYTMLHMSGKPAGRTTEGQIMIGGNLPNRMWVRGRYSTAEVWDRENWAEVYTDKNTTVGTNKEIIRSSPVLRVFKDGIEKIHEANDLDIEFIVNGVGDYTIKGTTGIRDGKEDWKINIPKDDHDNQLIAFIMEEEEGGVVHLKTYKRIFSMETFTFGPDLSTPVDIPEGRWVDLHFNDIPQEELDESEPVEEPLVDEEAEAEVVVEEEPEEESK